MSFQSFAGKHIVILGLARQGVALARFFHGQGAHVTISDIASADQLVVPLTQLDGLDRVRLVLGSHPSSLLDRCDLLCLSGGVPPQIPLVRAARRQGIPLTNDALVTIQRSPAPVIAITGSSGKTTTTTLVGLMMEQSGFTRADEGFARWAGPATSGSADEGAPGAGRQVWVGGNIGAPLVDRLEQVSSRDWLVLELSSFQLELFDVQVGNEPCGPDVAAILNITPNHLDRHPSMSHYAACKANLLAWQGSGDVVVLGADDAITGAWLCNGRVQIDAGEGQPAVDVPLAARSLGFGLDPLPAEGCWLLGDQVVLRLEGQERPVMAAGDVRLRGQHNLLNVMAACAISAVVGAAPEAMAEVARTFGGVPHRLEVVRQARGVRWINDSIATTPERAVAALRSFDEPIVLLAGGRDKKLPWDEFAALAHQRTRHVVVFGEAAGLIASAIERYQAGRPGLARLPVIHCGDLPAAVQAAAEVARPGDIVLLSPGGTSFDAYKDFEARGRHFRELVRAL